MSQIDYVHVYHTSLISNNKTISKIKETQSKKLWNLPQRNSYESAHYIFAELTLRVKSINVILAKLTKPWSERYM